MSALDDHPDCDMEMLEIPAMKFDSAWLHEYTWAPSCDIPIPATEETEMATAASACKNANTPQGSCIAITTGILGSMRGNSPLCLMGSHESPLSLSSSMSSSSSSSGPSNAPSASTTATSVDSVLSAAQEAAMLIRGLLDCPTCRAGAQLQLLLTVAFAEVIARYRCVISTYLNMRQRQQQHQGHRPHDELSRAPLSIGNHQIDGTIEAMVVGRVVSSRLRELESVMGDILPAQTQPQQPEGGILGGLYLGRDSFLAEQLSAARREVTELLLHRETEN
ncbi:hypothetical protein QBC43DRAFT_352103 [Cladorrhinum sp. PSN259]|nr:hypothetical protein QBC43DRAFT_352103 [Cladorrhinum sp. PSN259]